MAPNRSRFVHDALLYDTDEQLVETAVPFLREGADTGDVVVAFAPEATLHVLREALGEDSRISLRPVSERYSTPARTIAEYERTMRGAMASGARRFRALGEIDYLSRPQMRMEWARLEAMYNEVLAPFPAWGLCPLDTRKLDDEVLEAAIATHPNLATGTGRAPNPQFEDPIRFLERTSYVPHDALESTSPTLAIDDVSDIAEVRREIFLPALQSGLPADRAEDFVIALTEIITNAFLHGEPPVGLRLWSTVGTLIAVVSDTGAGFNDPLAGFRPPSLWESENHRAGLWVAGQLCDEMTPFRTGALFNVRLAMYR